MRPDLMIPSSPYFTTTTLADALREEHKSKTIILIYVGCGFRPMFGSGGANFCEIVQAEFGDNVLLVPCYLNRKAMEDDVNKLLE